MQSLILRTLIAAAAIGLTGCASTSKLANSAAPTNAMWNDSAKNKAVGFWLYGQPGTCPSIRTQRPIVFGTKDHLEGTSANHVPVSDLYYCYDLFPKEAGEYGNSCETGQLSYTYVPETRQYKGQYKFTFTNGMIREGEFLANYCPPGVAK